MTGSGFTARIYVDSNVFIYAVEGNGDLADALAELLELFARKPGLAITSELTLAEILAKADRLQRRDYLDLIVESGAIELCPVNRDILIETAAYRRVMGATKLADAIHAVTALQYGCSILLSADRRMRIPTGLKLIDTDPHSLHALIKEFS
ncbi:type II toxin-antitoxin system VapC family toxin [Tardiphaga alba]|uniref:Ribonuclease VapC n=1 Tax=Tardiphaga alba TaxID=340268 RepID=A0ABX8AFS1_9BRAD|nr:PIN domain-containing protein [Tardiphaga alba]QUS41464.1 type II toxin-antitoxin system VapC family toxin [Tardiphaga alba]